MAVSEAESATSPAAALEELEAVFGELRAQGLSPELRRLPSGQWVVVLVTPELLAPANTAALRAIEGQTLDIADTAAPLLPVPDPSRVSLELDGTGLRASIVRRLRVAGYVSLLQVHEAGPEAIAAVHGIGPKSFLAIVTILARHGLQWPATTGPDDRTLDRS